MDTYLKMAQIDETVQSVREKMGIQPRAGLILGSGLGGLAESVEEARIIEYSDLPHWPRSSVEGHSGRLVLGNLFGCPVMALQGRVHYYEGVSMSEVTLPVRVMQRLGMNTLVLTNAAGAVNPDFQPGEVMLITDHIGLVGMAGVNPLRGPNLNELGPRFPDMSQVYDREYQAWVREYCASQEIPLREGVYCGLSGPNFETPADLRFLRAIGADAVGMSTVPEAIVARHGGMRILGLSGISNKANLDGSSQTTHAEVLEAGRVLVPHMRRILAHFLTKL